MFLLCPVQVDAGIDVGALIVQAMADAELCHSALWRDQGYPDASQWSKALRGQAPLDLWRLRQVRSIKFWQSFLSRFASALIKQFFEDLPAPVRMARASIREHEARQQQQKEHA